ncbi:MAG: prephenate dehydratase [Nitrosopumilaceae archaeon]|nr:prephenate dehydratase [Nitrosopumilaceae archaeon]
MSEMVKVSFQGERGAYSESAAKEFFKKEIQTVAFPTFAEILQSTADNKTDYSILPVENSIEGSVGESYDLLYSTQLKAVGEIYFKIEHCLIGNSTLDKIDTVYSHPQALGQCRKFIQKQKFKTVPTYDTAGSVSIIKELNKENTACIASKSAAEISDMKIISENIADNPNNYTRFLILSKDSTDESDKDKTSIIFSIKHEPGSLYKIIEKFQKYGINLTKIESRPKKTTVWEYNFYVDFEGHANNSEIKKMLDEIKKETNFFKNLGSYPSAKLS